MVKPRTYCWFVFAVVAIAGLGAACTALAAPDFLGVAPPKAGARPALAGQVCAACHGANGVATAATFPNLAGQNYNYLLKALEAFRGGAWQASPMASIIATVPPAKDHHNLKQLAVWYSQQTLQPHNMPGAKPAKAVVEAGYRLYFQGNRASAVPACAACHLASGMGNAPMAVPRLANQNAAYVVAQLKAFAAGKRQTAPANVMDKIATRLSAKQMQAVAAYVHVMRPQLLPVRGPSTFKTYSKGLQKQPVPGVPAAAVAISQDQGQAHD